MSQQKMLSLRSTKGISLRSTTGITSYSKDDLDLFNIQKNNYISEGKKGLDENKFFTLINYLMNNIIFRSFFDEYFKDWDQTKTTLMFLKTYQAVDMNLSRIEYTTKKKFENRDELMIGIIKKLIDNSETRRQIVQSMNNFMNTDLELDLQIQKNLE